MSDPESPVQPQPQSFVVTNSTRLYISPLTPELLPAVLPSALHDVAHNITYHAPQTFPEKPFGYISLPSGDAARLRSKLHRSILRGIKMRVEEARPHKVSRRKTRAAVNEDDDNDDDDAPSGQGDSKAKEEKKAKKLAIRHSTVRDEDKLFPAIELPEGRSVKRGWSSTDKKKDRKGKKHGRDESERRDDEDKGSLIFRTKAPENAPGQERDERKHRRHGKSSSTTEVTEFANTTTFPAFLRDNNLVDHSQRTTEFVEGKGWVDQDGNLLEAVQGQRKRRKTRASADEGRPSRATITPDTAIPSKEAEIAPLSATVQTDEQPFSIAADSEKGISATPDPSTMPASQSSDVTPSFERKTDSKEIHPLEALFKRPAPKSQLKSTSKSRSESSRTDDGIHRPAPIKTSFSFFSSNEGKEGSEEPRPAGSLMMPPQTPFTKQDMEMRGIRSAAPTPDTAAIGKRFKMPWRRGTNDGSESSEDEDEDEDEEEDGDEDEDEGNSEERTVGVDVTAESKDTQDEPTEGVTASNDLNKAAGAKAKEEGEEQTEFEKHFWEHRAEYNRAWKARQREARKQARQAENRRRGGGRK